MSEKLDLKSITMTMRIFAGGFAVLCLSREGGGGGGRSSTDVAEKERCREWIGKSSNIGWITEGSGECREWLTKLVDGGVPQHVPRQETRNSKLFPPLLCSRNLLKNTSIDHQNSTLGHNHGLHRR
jgi:hypothetical protein